MKTIDEKWFRDWYNTFAENNTDPTTIAMYYLSKAGYGNPLMDYDGRDVDDWVFKIMDIGDGDYLDGKTRLMEAILSLRSTKKERPTLKLYYAKIYNHYIALTPDKGITFTGATAMAKEQWYEIGITESDAIFEEADDEWANKITT